MNPKADRTTVRAGNFVNRICLILIPILFVSCLGDELPVQNEEKSAVSLSPVAPDGVLETVTWNLKWYGSDSRGPDDENLQTDNVIDVIDSLQADLYALQEIHSEQSLDKLVTRMSGYRGFVAQYLERNQKMAIIYNTLTIDSLSSGALMEGQNGRDWASRYPLFFHFIYNYGDASLPIYAVVIHAKANSGTDSERQDAYQRRTRAANSLYSYLQKHKPDAHILLLGDFNDDVDVTIYDGSSPSPYYNFTGNSHFRTVTRSISELGYSSYVAGDYTDLIDHIVISNELLPYHIAYSEEIYFNALDFIPDFVATTSDHLPVWTKFDIR